jgi:tyrosinase
MLQQHAITIAQKYKNDEWLAAAHNLRAPYWDWATNSVPPPEVISVQTFNITTPDGKTHSVSNPLYQYKFNPISPSFPDPYSNWQTTIRHPDDPNSPDASSDPQALAQYVIYFS